KPDGTVDVTVYNIGGLLDQKVVTPAHGTETVFVEDIDYDAKGQRTLLRRGSGPSNARATTTYDYDPKTFRLLRLHSNQGTSELQDLNYTYDPIGNITELSDASQLTVTYDQTEVTAVQRF